MNHLNRKPHAPLSVSEKCKSTCGKVLLQYLAKESIGHTHLNVVCETVCVHLLFCYISLPKPNLVCFKNGKLPRRAYHCYCHLATNNNYICAAQYHDIHRTAGWWRWKFYFINTCSSASCCVFQYILHRHFIEVINNECFQEHVILIYCSGLLGGSLQTIQQAVFASGVEKFRHYNNAIYSPILAACFNASIQYIEVQILSSSVPLVAISPPIPLAPSGD